MRPTLLAAAVATAFSCFTVSSNAFALTVVFDPSVYAQTVQQYMQMVEQLNQLKAQLDQLKRQYDAVTGSYGVGAVLQEVTAAAQAMVPGSWQEIVDLQRSGKLRTKLDYYEAIMRKLDPVILQANQGRSADAFKLIYNNTRAAFAVTDATFESLEVHRQNIEQLMRRIDASRNIKEAADLGNRLVAENAMLQVGLARLSAVQNNLQASANNERVQSQATRNEMLRFDRNYEYRIRRP
jgi:type IV secretion system protein VirB5